MVVHITTRHGNARDQQEREADRQLDESSSEQQASQDRTDHVRQGTSELHCFTANFSRNTGRSFREKAGRGHEDICLECDHDTLSRTRLPLDRYSLWRFQPRQRYAQAELETLRSQFKFAMMSLFASRAGSRHHRFADAKAFSSSRPWPVQTQTTSRHSCFSSMRFPDSCCACTSSSEAGAAYADR